MKNIIKNIIKLSNHLFLWLWKSYIAKILGVSALLQMLLIWINIGIQSGYDHSDAFLPYERILSDSGVTILLMAGFLLIFAVILYHGLSLRHNHKPIYTILTLPMPREHIYIAFWLSSIACIAVFLAVNALLLVLWYVPITSIVNTHSIEHILTLDNGEKFFGMNNNIHNGLFLAFVRDPILGTMYPITLKGVCNTATVVLLLTSISYANIFSLKEKQWNIAYIIILVLGYYWIISVTLGIFSDLHDNSFRVIFELLILTVIATVIAIKKIRRGEGESSK